MWFFAYDVPEFFSSRDVSVNFHEILLIPTCDDYRCDTPSYFTSGTVLHIHRWNGCKNHVSSYTITMPKYECVSIWILHKHCYEVLCTQFGSSIVRFMNYEGTSIFKLYKCDKYVCDWLTVSGLGHQRFDGWYNNLGNPKWGGIGKWQIRLINSWPFV